MKRFLLILLIFASLGNFLAAQETGEGDDEKPLHWWEHLRGFTLGIEAGTHEYPLSVWYPSEETEGYSVRSFYLLPSAAYRRAIYDFNLYIKTEAAVDIGAPDPSFGVRAVNSETADRKNWATLYSEEKVDYPLSKLFNRPNFPGILSIFLHLENHFYATPDFPGGKKFDGMVEFGPAAYTNDFNFGTIYGELGLPLFYLNRYNDDLGFGMNFTAGYHDGFGIGLGVEITNRLLFIPAVRHSETEFSITYDWLDFTAKLDISGQDAFRTMVINPEIKYHFYNYTFTLGMEFSGIRVAAAFSPYLGFDWSY